MQGLTGKEEIMIDVSHHDTVDWQKVANAGIKKAYLKASEGIGVADDSFAGNVKWAHVFGIEVGAYHFCHPELNQDPIAEADYFLSIIDGYNLDLMPCLDIESPVDNTKWGLTPKYVSEWARNWVDHVQAKTGHTVSVYTGRWYVNNMSLYGLGNQPLWISYYVSTPPKDCGDWANWEGWQYTESQYIDGVRNLDGSYVCDVSYVVSEDSFRVNLKGAKKMQPIDSWAQEMWDWGVSKGIVDGNSHPQDLTKEEVVVRMIFEYAKSIEKDQAVKEPSDWAKIAWTWAQDQKIVDGNGHPHGYATEEIVVGIIKSHEDRKDAIAKANHDNPVPSDWAKAAWQWGIDNGIVNNKPDQSHPHGTVTEEILLGFLKAAFDKGVFTKK